MSQSAGTSGFAPAWGVHHCPSLQASKGGSSYGSRGRPPDTTGRAVPLTGFPGGFLEEGSRPRITAAHRQACSRTNIHKDHGPTMPAGTTPPSSPTYDSHRLHLPNSTDGSRTLTQLRLSNDKAIDISRQQELSSRLEDAECARHRPLEPQIGPRLYTTSLRLHQPRLIPSTWRRGTTSRLPPPAHNAGDSSRPPDEGGAGRLSISTRTAFFYFRGGLVFN